jgi:hypothetical protein
MDFVHSYVHNGSENELEQTSLIDSAVHRSGVQYQYGFNPLEMESDLFKKKILVVPRSKHTPSQL